MGLFEAILKKEQFYSHPFRTPVTKVAGQFWPLKGQVGQKSKKATKYVHVGCKTFQMNHCPLPYLPYRPMDSGNYHRYYMILKMVILLIQLKHTPIGYNVKNVPLFIDTKK